MTMAVSIAGAQISVAIIFGAWMIGKAIEGHGSRANPSATPEKD